MNTTKMSPESTMTQPDKQWREVSTTETDLNTTKSALTVSQDAAICPVRFRSQWGARSKRSASREIAGHLQAALLGRAMGRPVRTIHKDGVEETVPRRLSICHRSVGSAVFVFFANGRRGLFRVEQGAVVYTLSSSGKSALRHSHRFGRKSDNREAPVSVLNRENSRGLE